MFVIGCEPYINCNVGSGAVQEMSEWVEYMTFDRVSPMAQVPWLDVSASVAEDGTVYVTLANLSADQAKKLECPLPRFGEKRYTLVC